jgi:Ser/Thr protein kinase RdoA (MazF antagonist)
MSAAALVRHGDTAVFVKRHHLGVRTPGQLTAEHAFAGHLRERGLPVPAVLRLPDGESVLRRGEYCYEVHQVADGIDLYREAATWSPYASLGHAYAAGAALGRLHLAAADFRPEARPPAVLMNSSQVITAPDPLLAASALAAQRPALAAYLAGRRWEDHFDAIVSPLIADAAPALAALPSQWGHGDWHPSNLTWTSAAPDAGVAGIFDFGLANRTSAVHDLALALERAVVGWPGLHQGGTADADPTAAAFLLDGYQTVRPLTGAEAAALPLVLPVAHVEYALSEIDYFTSVAVSAGDADLAYEYLIGHAWWFTQPPGAALLGFLAGHLRRARARLPGAVTGRNANRRPYATISSPIRDRQDGWRRHGNPGRQGRPGDRGVTGDRPGDRAAAGRRRSRRGVQLPAGRDRRQGGGRRGRRGRRPGPPGPGRSGQPG